jgi:uncharacterized protein YbdZ (MbtH family)
MSINDSDREDTTIYKAVVNHEEQYSIWPADRENPLGWTDAGKVGRKEECLEYIKEVWTDMRPLSLRKKMEEMAKNPPPPPPPASDEPRERGDDLVKRLSEGNHPVEVSLRPEKTAATFRSRIDIGTIHVRFTDTRGGTELGVRIDRDATDISKADFETGKGTVHIEGNLTLNYVPVRCIADIEMQTFEGRGYLVSDEPKMITV